MTVIFYAKIAVKQNEFSEVFSIYLKYVMVHPAPLRRNS